MELLFCFVFFYPLLMSFVWIAGSLVFEAFRADRLRLAPSIPGDPPVSVLIPCHNEEESIEETIAGVMRLDYPNFEVIAIDDASTDRTGELLARLQRQHPRLRVLTLTTNQGKAVGLTMAALVSRGECLVCVDADAVLVPQALRWLLWHFRWPRVGAVTGNPRVRNRTTVLAKIQVAEFSSIIGMIKRAQRILGPVFTVSGVVAAFRRTALLDVGFWSNNMMTEDVDISWKLQMAKWDIRYEPRAVCWILVPERIKGLFRQRLRWAQGGAEVLLKYARQVWHPSNRQMWPLFLESVLSIAWCYAFATATLLRLVDAVMDLPGSTTSFDLVPGWHGVLVATVCLAQLGTGLALDARYDRKLLRLSAWLLWYPAIFWLLSCAVTLLGVPKALFKDRTASAVWKSPDRGLGGQLE